jgi:hypothetical protein
MGLIGVAFCLLKTRLALGLLPARLQNETEQRVTMLVNAAVLGGRRHQYLNAPIVVKI